MPKCWSKQKRRPRESLTLRPVASLPSHMGITDGTNMVTCRCIPRALKSDSQERLWHIFEWFICLFCGWDTLHQVVFSLPVIRGVTSPVLAASPVGFWEAAVACLWDVRAIETPSAPSRAHEQTEGSEWKARRGPVGSGWHFYGGLNKKNFKKTAHGTRREGGSPPLLFTQLGTGKDSVHEKYFVCLNRRGILDEVVSCLLYAWVLKSRRLWVL